MLIYKILLPAEWAAFEAAGVFAGSPLDLRDGYLHFSTREQVPGTVERYFAGEPELVVVAVEADPLREWLRWEGSFPHLYAPLPRSAVTAVHDLPTFELG